MNQEQKQEAVKEIGEELASSTAVFAINYRGISVPQAAELRERLRDADARFSVIKNRLAMRATAEAGAESIDEYLVGPTALAFVKGDAVVAAKAITAFSREHGVLAYKGGFMDGSPLDADSFNEIARLPALDVLHGQLVGLAASPITGLVTSLNGLLQGLAVQLGQMAEQGLVSGDAPAGGAEAPAEEAGGAVEAEAAGGAGAEPEEEASANGDDEADAEAAADSQEEEQAEGQAESAAEESGEGSAADAAAEVEPTESAEPESESSAEDGEEEPGAGETSQEAEQSDEAEAPEGAEADQTDTKED